VAFSVTTPYSGLASDTWRASDGFSAIIAGNAAASAVSPCTTTVVAFQRARQKRPIHSPSEGSAATMIEPLDESVAIGTPANRD
jgi:hypothetical protein